MWITEAFKWGRWLFIMIKGLFILYFTSKAIKRYRETRGGVLIHFESVIMAGIMILDLILMGFEIYHDINFVFIVFTINALMQISSSHFIFRHSMNSLKFKTPFIK